MQLVVSRTVQPTHSSVPSDYRAWVSARHAHVGGGHLDLADLAEGVDH
jgi:hypothetical protein